jgi:hypothetical protein
MLRTWIEDVIGRLKQLGSHADGLEEENRSLQAELSALHEARRDNDDGHRLGRHHRVGPEPTRRPGRVPGICEAVPRSEDDASDRRPRRVCRPLRVCPIEQSLNFRAKFESQLDRWRHSPNSAA